MIVHLPATASDRSPTNLVAVAIPVEFTLATDVAPVTVKLLPIVQDVLIATVFALRFRLFGLVTVGVPDASVNLIPLHQNSYLPLYFLVIYDCLNEIPVIVTPLIDGSVGLAVLSRSILFCAPLMLYDPVQ